VHNVHSAHFVLHVTSNAIMKELDDLLQSYRFYVGCGFWFLGCQLFKLFCLVSRFLHYMVPIFLVRTICFSRWFKLLVLHWRFGFWVLSFLDFGFWFWIPKCLGYSCCNSSGCWIISNKFLYLDT